MSLDESIKRDLRNELAEALTRVKELEESIKTYRGAIVESGDLKKENARMSKVVDAARKYLKGGSSQRLRDALRKLDGSGSDHGEKCGCLKGLNKSWSRVSDCDGVRYCDDCGHCSC